MKNKLLIILSIYAITLVIFRVFYTNSGFYLFLVWNLFLAVIPYLITNFLKQNKNSYLFYFLFPIWLLFLPNAPYIITDLFHLPQGTLMPLWYDLLLIVVFSVNGMVLFFYSLNDMFNEIKEKYSIKIAQFIISISIFLSGFGIYLGRYLRWNSWEILQNPKLLFYDILKPIINPTQHPRTWGITFGYGFLFIICYSLFKSLSEIKDLKNQ